MTAAIETRGIRMGIELLVLTLDGVMFDTEDAHRRACNIAFQACGIDRHWNIASFRTAAARRGAALAVMDAEGISTRDMKTVLQEKHDAFHALVLDGAVSVIDECLSLAEDALADGCKLAVVTDLPARTTTALLEQAYGDAVNDVFSVVASGTEIRHASGNGPYQLALRTVGVEAEHAAAIEASASGIDDASASGIWTFAASMHGRSCLSHSREWSDRPDQVSVRRIRSPRMVRFAMLCMLKDQEQLRKQQNQHRRNGMPARRSA